MMTVGRTATARTAARLPAEVMQGASLNDRLRLAIDIEYLLPALRAEWRTLSDAGITLENCTVDRVLPRGTGTPVIKYDLHLNGPNGRTICGAFGELPLGDPDRHMKKAVHSLAKVRRGQLPISQAHHQFCLVSMPGLVIRMEGLDTKLPGLRMLRDPNAITADLPEQPDWLRQSGIRAELLAHRLGRRGVVRLSSGGNGAGRSSIIAKLYKQGSHRGARVHDVMRFLRASSFGPAFHLRVPASLGHLPTWSVLLMEEVTGESPLQLRAEVQNAGMRIAGEALGQLHSSPLRVEYRFGPDDEIALIKGWAQVVSDVLPEYERQIFQSLDVVLALFDRCGDNEDRLIHRDYHEKQILTDGETGYIIDFDTLCVGDSAQDLGNFIAHLKFAGLQGGVDAQSLSEHFLDAYQRFGPPIDPVHLAAHQASTLLRLACIYAFSSQWRHLAHPLLDLVR